MNYDVSLQTIAWINGRRNDGTLEISPKFQRRAVWMEAERKALIGTIMDGLPFPEIYVQQETDPNTGAEKHIVVDGQQRVTTILMFIDNDFRKAIRKLQEVELNDVFYQLDARVILLKCFYELDDTDSFFYQASAFRLFLLRNRHISDYQKNIYRNLIKFLTAIVRSSYSRTKLLKIQSEIEQEKNVADLNWLRTKVNEAIAT